MAKQKIVVKVTMNNDRKVRRALKIAVSISGVESAAFLGSDEGQIAVIGEGIDSVQLATLLRKGVGDTELISVGPVEEKPAAPPAADQTTPTVVPPQHMHLYPCPYPYWNDYYCTPIVYDVPNNNDHSCPIM